MSGSESRGAMLYCSFIPSDGDFCCVPCPCTISMPLSLDVCVSVSSRTKWLSHVGFDYIPRAGLRPRVYRAVHFCGRFVPAGLSNADVVGGHQTLPN